MQHLYAIGAMTTIVLAMGCGGAATTSSPDARNTPPASDEANADDDARFGQLGTLHRTETPAPVASGTEMGEQDAPRGRLIGESPVRGAEKQSVALHERTFADGEGFRIDPVPPGVSFYRVDREPGLWVVRDARGRRIALIAERPWRKMADPKKPSLVTRTADVHRTVDVDDWQGHDARIVVEQFQQNSHVYRIERLAGDATRWIGSGWWPVEPGTGDVEPTRSASDGSP